MYYDLDNINNELHEASFTVFISFHNVFLSAYFFMWFVNFFQLQLDEQNRLLTERGMVLVGNEGSGDEDEVADEGRPGPSSGEQEQRTRAIVSSETASILSGLGKGPLDVRLDPFLLFCTQRDQFEKLILIALKVK